MASANPPASTSASGSKARPITSVGGTPQRESHAYGHGQWCAVFPASCYPNAKKSSSPASAFDRLSLSDAQPLNHPNALRVARPPFDARARESRIVRLALNTNEIKPLEHGGAARRARAGKRVEHKPTRRCDQTHKPAHQLDRLHGRMVICAGSGIVVRHRLLLEPVEPSVALGT